MLGYAPSSRRDRLTDEEAKTLEEWTRRGKKGHRLVERARIILLAVARFMWCWTTEYAQAETRSLAEVSSSGAIPLIPTYSSWLNQVEVWFSILSRQALRGASFTSPCTVAASHR